MVPVYDWIHRCIISIFLVFMIAFLPLFLQGLTSHCFLCRSFLDDYFRTHRARHWEGHFPVEQAVHVIVSGFRGLFDSAVDPLHFEQFDVRWCSLHCYWSWFCDIKDIIQHPLFPLRWSEHIPWDEDVVDVAIRDASLLDTLPHLFLGFNPCTLCCPVFVQSSPILLHGVHC